jgi:hypothetical protein
MPYADPDTRRAYHKAYSHEWFKRQTPEYRAARTEARKAAQRKWLDKNPDHNKKYYAANKDKFRERNLRQLYGISAQQYAAMLTAQGGRCAICRTDKPGGARRFPVDHCHTTGKVRGLLCVRCNANLGALEVWYAEHKAKIDSYLANAK